LAFDSNEVAAERGAFNANKPFRRRARDGFLSPSTTERSKNMFTRVVEMTSKAGKSQEVANTINDRAVPILKKQRGFVDEIVLISSGKADQVLALSFWNEREDAEEYRKEQYQKIHDMVWPLLETEPEIRTFDVHTSTTHKIAASKAA
jgi:heme-degrading monooxygenase HmoA